MKVCPKCEHTHEKQGIFCSRSCANSRGPRTKEFKTAVSNKLSGRKLSESHISNMSGDNHPKRKGRNFPQHKTIGCLYCNSEFVSKNEKHNFCCRLCYNKHFEDIRTEWEQYSIACRFKFNVYDYPTLFDLTLIDEHGWYKASNKGNNLGGISRDHSYSVKEGFKNNIDPKIISHPANCVLMKQDDNSSKKTKCNITIEELLERICVVGRAIEGSSLQP